MATQKERIIFLIDALSFYASVEKAMNPAYKDKPLIVSGSPERRSGIVLAACSIAKKKYRISTADRLWEAIQKCPEVVVVPPRMQLYIDVSIHITNILETFTDLVEPYSIDEQFLDVTNTIHLFNKTPEELAADIQSQILNQTGIWTRVGISNSKVLSKLACDLIAKKNESGIFTLRKEDLSKYIWHLPVQEMWSIGSRMQRHLNRMGIRTIGDLARTPLPRLKIRWGINGEVIYRVANGIDNSKVTINSYNHQKAIGNGMTLPRDYSDSWEIEAALLTLVTQVCRRCRQKNVHGEVVSVSCTGADWDHPTGFNRQKKLESPTNTTLDVYLEAKRLFHQHWDGLPIRRIGVSLSGLESDSVVQLTLFDFDNQEKKRKIDKVMDLVCNKYGETALVRASSFTEAGLAKDRSGRIGGHFK